MPSAASAATDPSLSHTAVGPAPLRRGAIVGIDGLRAICVGIVMVAHYGLERFVPGGLGVTAFFFISGFLITTLLLREFTDTGNIQVGRFYIRRLLRLNPELLALIILAGYVFYAYKAPIIDAAAGAFYFTNYFQIFVPPPTPEIGYRFPHLWSLAVEEHYYLTYPLLFAVLARKGRRVWPVLVAVCIVSLALRQLYLSLGFPPSHAYQATETRIDSIAYGCLAAFILWHHGQRVVAALSKRRALATISFGVFLLFVTLVYRDVWFRETLRYSVQGIALMAIMIGLQGSALGQTIARHLDNPPMQWMGRMSYAAYLWHLESENMLSKVIDFGALRSTPGGIVVAIVILSALTFAIAYLSHLLIYRSFLGLRHRFGSHAS